MNNTKLKKSEYYTSDRKQPSYKTGCNYCLDAISGGIGAMPICIKCGAEFYTTTGEEGKRKCAECEIREMRRYLYLRKKYENEQRKGRSGEHEQGLAYFV